MKPAFAKATPLLLRSEWRGMDSDSSRRGPGPQGNEGETPRGGNADPGTIRTPYATTRASIFESRPGMLSVIARPSESMVRAVKPSRSAASWGSPIEIRTSP